MKIQRLACPLGVLLAVILRGLAFSQPFIHPGCLSTSNDLARIKVKVGVNAQPWKAGYDVLTANSHAQLGYNPRPQGQICRGGSCASENYILMCNDAAAAYQTALRYHVNGNTNYANKSIQIMDSWANTLTNITGSTDALLALGGQGYQWACAAELMRDYQPWIASGAFTNFQAWLLREFYSECRRFLLGTGSSTSDHNGTCDTHYWANWDLFAMDALISIAVVCDRRDIYNDVINYFKTGLGNGAADKVVFFTHPGYLGQWQEAGRDQGHSIFGPILLGVFCEIAWNQGDDLYSYASNVLLAGSEYVTKYNLWNPVPFVTYINCEYDLHANVSSAARGGGRPGWDLIYNHYVNRVGLSAPFTGAMAERERPEGGGGNYGPNSGGYDQLGFTTLTHTLDPIATNGVPAPSLLQAEVRHSAVILSWWGSAYATSYKVKRATSLAGPYATIASVPAPTHCYTNLGLLQGTTYYYVLSAVMDGLETTNSTPVSATPNRLLSGTIIGSSGSYNNWGASKETLFDGALGNWYDADSASGDWAGLDLGRGHVITQVRYAPRLFFNGRMVGGQFQGANVPDFSSGVVTLYTIGSAPPDMTMTSSSVSNTNTFRYVRYLGPNGGNCNAAEIQFFGIPMVTAPPVVAITAPGELAKFPPGTIPLTATAGAPNGDVPIARVEFFAGITKIGEATNEPYTLNWSNAPMGRFKLTARVTDSLARTGTSAPVHIIIATPATLIATGSVWKYNASGANLGEAWRSNGFNDSSWPAGPAMLGFGDANGIFPATVIASNRQVTTYFRQRFVVADPSLALRLNLRLMRDDGAVVFLNGAEVWRDTNFAAGPITSTNLASVGLGGDDESAWLEATLDPAALISGTNLIAVEVHQSSTTSSDLALDLELATEITGPNQPPTVFLASPADGAVVFPDVMLVATASDSDTPIERVEFFSDAMKVGEVLAPPYALAVALPVGTNAFFAIATDNAGARATSAMSRVTVGQTVTAMFIAAGANWRYFDKTNDLGTAWRDNPFSDMTWSNGSARLGYGNDGEVTKVASNRQWTTYFRHPFFVADAALVTNLVARLTCDDAAVIYLNGAEVWRDTNITSGTITYATPALVALAGADETNWLTFNLQPSTLNLLQPGWNLLAVEVHNQSLTSSDLGFDFELTGDVLLTSLPSLALAIEAGTVALSWPTDASYFAVDSAPDLMPPVAWTPLTNAAVLSGDQWRINLPSTTNGQRYFRLRWR